MPAIHNPNRTLRFTIELADFAAKDAAFVCTAAVEFFDRRDKKFWPIVQLPVLRISQPDGHALTDAMRGVCDMSRPGFSFRTGAMEELQLQIGREPSGVAIEIGIDLAAYLMESAGVRSEPGKELALFRFSAELRELVVFGDGIEARVAQLEGRAAR